jgi:hypothetical protein
MEAQSNSACAASVLQASRQRARIATGTPHRVGEGAVIRPPFTASDPYRAQCLDWAGVIILSCVCIYDDAVVVAGSVVTRDVPAGATALVTRHVCGLSLLTDSAPGAARQCHGVPREPLMEAGRRCRLRGGKRRCRSGEAHHRPGTACAHASHGESVNSVTLIGIPTPLPRRADRCPWERARAAPGEGPPNSALRCCVRRCPSYAPQSRAPRLNRIRIGIPALVEKARIGLVGAAGVGQTVRPFADGWG